jgi:hypothetical protein
MSSGLLDMLVPILRGSGEMGLYYRHRHDVENGAYIGIFRIRQFFVASTIIVRLLNLAIDPWRVLFR